MQDARMLLPGGARGRVLLRAGHQRLERLEERLDAHPRALPGLQEGWRPGGRRQRHPGAPPLQSHRPLFKGWPFAREGSREDQESPRGRDPPQQRPEGEHRGRRDPERGGRGSDAEAEAEEDKEGASSESQVLQPEQRDEEPGFAGPPEEHGEPIPPGEEDERLDGGEERERDRRAVLPRAPLPRDAAHGRKICSSRKPRSSSRICAARSKSSSFAAAFISFSSSAIRRESEAPSGRSGREMDAVAS